MKIVTKIKENLFLVAVIAAYAVLFIVKSELGVTAVKNSGYYIKEMLMIMPVIFVLTALLDTWVPKHTIMKYLGRESRIKGIVLSIVLGSISAGPIYAAFPFCIMLHKKGASIRNIVIILSAWAVIKVPMLLNEAKFLGLSFMAVRWALTVVAILIFSWITAKIVKDRDLPDTEKKTRGVAVNRAACMGCSLCVKKYPELFEMQSRKAVVREPQPVIDSQRLHEVMKACPAKAICTDESGTENLETPRPIAASPED